MCNKANNVKLILRIHVAIIMQHTNLINKKIKTIKPIKPIKEQIMIICFRRPIRDLIKMEWVEVVTLWNNVRRLGKLFKNVSNWGLKVYSSLPVIQIYMKVTKLKRMIKERSFTCTFGKLIKCYLRNQTHSFHLKAHNILKGNLIYLMIRR